MSIPNPREAIDSLFNRLLGAKLNEIVKGVTDTVEKMPDPKMKDGGRQVIGVLAPRLQTEVLNPLRAGVQQVMTMSMPQMPKLPQAPQMPKLPQAPQMPKLPQAPQMPKLPQAPQMPGSIPSASSIVSGIASKLSGGKRTRKQSRKGNKKTQRRKKH